MIKFLRSVVAELVLRGFERLFGNAVFFELFISDRARDRADRETYQQFFHYELLIMLYGSILHISRLRYAIRHKNQENYHKKIHDITSFSKEVIMLDFVGV